MKAPAQHTTSPRQLEWWAKEAVVYFIGAGRPLIAVKIGVSAWATMARRLRSLQSSNHEPLELLGVIAFREGQYPMQAAERREWELHEKFIALQRAAPDQCGHEWFTASAELLAFINANSRRPEVHKFPRTLRQT